MKIGSIFKLKSPIKGWCKSCGKITTVRMIADRDAWKCCKCRRTTTGLDLVKAGIGRNG